MIELETIKEELNDYMQENSITYFRKSNLADFACKGGYEIEDIYELFDNSYQITRFTERINGTRYRRYLLGDLNTAQIENATGLKCCYNCGCFTATAVTSKDDKHFCDMECANRCNYYTCSKCGELVNVKYHYNGTNLCKECLDLHYTEYGLQKCTRCKNYYRTGQLYQVNDSYYCNSCASHLSAIGCYHDSSRPTFKPMKKNREKPVYFGWENEFECKGDTPVNIVVLGLKDLLKKAGLEKFFIFENDSSLDNGCEAISQPLTLPCLYDIESKLQPVYDYWNEKQCTGDKCKTAGLHIHFSRTALKKDYSLAKIAFLVNKLQYDFLKYSNRKLNCYPNHYSGIDYTQFDELNNDNEAVLGDFKNKYYSNSYQNTKHSSVVNTQHKNTVEIRLFKGTLDLHRIIANVELIDNLIYYVENHTDTQVENVTFKELCLFKKTRYLKQYYYKIFEPNTKIKNSLEVT